MITLESTRKDVFPLTKGSRRHQTIVNSHAEPYTQDLFQLLDNLSYTAKILTGESSGYDSPLHSPRRYGTWRDSLSDTGGINIPNLVSTSTHTLKNFLASHCGVSGMPIDFAVEVDYDIYQPCLPQILYFYSRKATLVSKHGQDDFHSQPWSTTFIQAATDQFDHQYKLMKKIGFQETVARPQIQDPKSKFYPPTEPESKYFGYPDSQVTPFIRDAIQSTKSNSQHFFISHLTSTTHHPWALPPAFGEPKQYMGSKGIYDGTDVNNYLNTIKYGDAWLAEIMDLLEQTGVANKTLVVIAGDHGMAFREDDTTYTTYNGAHIAKFRIPLVFYHPHLPRTQLSANANTLSVLPTIFDLLAYSDSLSPSDMATTRQLLAGYEGQSLIRTYRARAGPHQHQWHISIMSVGGSFLAVSSAAYTYRLVMPLCKAAMFQFTDPSLDETERIKVEDWSIGPLARRVEREFGGEAGRWVREAKAVGTWWYWGPAALGVYWRE